MFTSEMGGSGRATVRGAGKLNMVSAPFLRETVLELLREDRNEIVVDLSKTDFVDSSGLGAVVACLNSTRHVDDFNYHRIDGHNIWAINKHRAPANE